MELNIDLLKSGIKNNLPVGVNISIKNKVENGNCIGVFAHRGKNINRKQD